MTPKLYQAFLNAEKYLDSLGNLKTINFFDGTSDPNHHFKRAQHLLKLAGQPDKAFKIIHVAGTSGKGTVSNQIYNILQSAGYKVGAHFSPFVSVSTEKIQINNKFISLQEFVDLVEEAKPIIEKCYRTYDAPSHFEVWFLLALMYFKKQKCDYAVIEAGCGGRYDGSNAVVKTEVSIITNIGLDHEHILGKTIKEIAWQKAGIIRKRGQVFTSATRPDALQVMIEVCDKQKAFLNIIDAPDHPNEALAGAIGNYLGLAEQDIEAGIKKAKLPCRFEIMQTNPLVILDGAHNPDKIAFLAEKIKTLKKLGQKIHLVCGLTDHKNPAKCFSALKPLIDKVYCTRFTSPSRKVTLPETLVKAFKGKTYQTFLDPKTALMTALKKASTKDIVLVAGSFYLAGELRSHWLDEVTQLEMRNNFLK